VLQHFQRGVMVQQDSARLLAALEADAEVALHDEQEAGAARGRSRRCALPCSKRLLAELVVAAVLIVAVFAPRSAPAEVAPAGELAIISMPGEASQALRAGRDPLWGTHAANCAVNVGFSAVYLGKSGLGINAAVQTCYPQDTKAEKTACAASVAGLIAGFLYSGYFISAAAVECESTLMVPNKDRLLQEGCAADFMVFSGTLALLASTGAAMHAVCLKEFSLPSFNLPKIEWDHSKKKGANKEKDEGAAVAVETAAATAATDSVAVGTGTGGGSAISSTEALAFNGAGRRLAAGNVSEPAVGGRLDPSALQRLHQLLDKDERQKAAVTPEQMKRLRELVDADGSKLNKTAVLHRLEASTRKLKKLPAAVTKMKDKMDEMVHKIANKRAEKDPDDPIVAFVRHSDEVKAKVKTYEAWDGQVKARRANNAACALDLAAATLFIARAGILINYGITDCSKEKLATSGQEGDMLCTVMVTSIIGAFTFVGSLLSYAVAHCDGFAQYAGPLCAASIIDTIGGIAEVAAASSDFTLNCEDKGEADAER